MKLWSASNDCYKESRHNYTIGMVNVYGDERKYTISCGTTMYAYCVRCSYIAIADISLVNVSLTIDIGHVHFPKTITDPLKRCFEPHKLLTDHSSLSALPYNTNPWCGHITTKKEEGNFILNLRFKGICKTIQIHKIVISGSMLEITVIIQEGMDELQLYYKTNAAILRIAQRKHVIINIKTFGVVNIFYEREGCASQHVRSCHVKQYESLTGEHNNPMSIMDCQWANMDHKIDSINIAYFYSSTLDIYYPAYDGRLLFDISYYYHVHVSPSKADAFCRNHSKAGLTRITNYLNADFFLHNTLKK